MIKNIKTISLNGTNLKKIKTIDWEDRAWKEGNWERKREVDLEGSWLELKEGIRKKKLEAGKTNYCPRKSAFFNPFSLTDFLQCHRAINYQENFPRFYFKSFLSSIHFWFKNWKTPKNVWLLNTKRVWGN